MMHSPVVSQSGRRDAATLVIRALVALGDGLASLEEHRGTAWASATFSGMRHRLTLSFAGDKGVARGEWLAQILAEHEFDLPGHIVADAVVIERHVRREGTPALTLTIEMLTVEDD